jgi:cytochrome c-type biogenesis protein CcmH/NrfF
MAQSQQNIINEVFECIRDASSVENTRAIQDSESMVAQEQKKLIKTLIKKGWSKNEIVYEVQRLYGNDVLIIKYKLDDERGVVGKYGLPFFLVMAATSLIFIKRRRMLQS